MKSIRNELIQPLNLLILWILMKYTWNLYLFCIYTCIYYGLYEINLFVFIVDLSMESYYIYCLSIYWNVYSYILLLFIWNLYVHVSYKLIPLKLIYFEGRACYIGKINWYMYNMISSFVLDLIVKAVVAAGAACSSLHYLRRCELQVKLLDC